MPVQSHLEAKSVSTQRLCSSYETMLVGSFKGVLPNPSTLPLAMDLPIFYASAKVASMQHVLLDNT